METDIKEVLFTNEEIHKKLEILGEQISKDYYGKDLLLVGILNGACMFLADLVKYIKIPVQIDFMGLKSYEGIHNKESIKITKDLKINPHNKHIIIIEDIIDTGKTMEWLLKHFKLNKCSSVELCILLEKETERRDRDFDTKYLAFKCSDVWVVGYGFDYNEYYRNLSYIGELKEEIYKN